MMAKSRNFSIISGEMAHCSPPKLKEDIDIRAKTDDITELAVILHKKIQGAKGLHKIRPPRNPTPFWSLLLNTSWRLTNPKLDQVKAICAVAVGETEEAALQSSAEALLSKHTMDLRFGIWLTVNLWLRWNPTALPGAQKSFSYWDQCPDQVTDVQGVYWGETAEKVSKLMTEDMRLLKELGDMLTSFPALTNNRDAAPSHRVISIEVKSKVDAILKVSKVAKGVLNA